MTDITVLKLNEAYVKIECEKHFAQELSSYFEFRVPGYQFTPAYKNKIWDGKIRLFSLRDFTLYSGLISYVEKFCKERDYSLQIEPKLKILQNFSLKEAQDFIDSLNLPFEVRDYQIKSFAHAIRNKKILLLSPTGSGKSLIIYLILQYLQKNSYKKGLLIVPTISLVHQMYKDFESYGYNSDENCHMIYQGQQKESNKLLYISTWQSIYKNDPEYFHQFDFVIGDECHMFKAKSLTTIMVNCINASYRIGCTGTLTNESS